MAWFLKVTERIWRQWDEYDERTKAGTWMTFGLKATRTLRWNGENDERTKAGTWAQRNE